MDFLRSFLSVTSAGILLVSSALKEVAPQNDAESLLFLANRQWTLSEHYVPTTVIAHVKGQVRYMQAEAAAALEEMFAACKAEIRVNLAAVSGYRSYGKQNNLYNRKLKSVKGNVDKADEYVARPGASEHQLGLAMDVGQLGSDSQLTASFGKTKGGQWLKEHCYEYGFILRYQEGWEDVTGYQFEPWHVRYVGKEAAMKIKEANVPYETWLAEYRTEVLQRILKGE